VDLLFLVRVGIGAKVLGGAAEALTVDGGEPVGQHHALGLSCRHGRGRAGARCHGVGGLHGLGGSAGRGRLSWQPRGLKHAGRAVAGGPPGRGENAMEEGLRQLDPQGEQCLARRGWRGQK